MKTRSRIILAAAFVSAFFAPGTSSAAPTANAPLHPDRVAARRSEEAKGRVPFATVLAPGNGQASNGHDAFFKNI